MLKTMITGAACALAISTAPASAATIITSSHTFTGVGGDPGSAYDQVVFGGATADPRNLIILLNTITFNAGGTGPNSIGTHTGTLFNTGTIDGKSFSYGIDYTIVISGYDTLTIGGNSFDALGYHFALNSQTLSSMGTPAMGNILATMSASAVPEPATWTMMILGMGAIGFAMRRQRKVRTNVSFA